MLMMNFKNPTNSELLNFLFLKDKIKINTKIKILLLILSASKIKNRQIILKCISKYMLHTLICICYDSFTTFKHSNMKLSGFLKLLPPGPNCDRLYTSMCRLLSRTISFVYVCFCVCI